MCPELASKEGSRRLKGEVGGKGDENCEEGGWGNDGWNITQKMYVVRDKN